MASTRIAELAAIIAEHTKSIDEQLASEGLPSPSFDADCPPRLLQGDSKVVASRQAILDATDELQALMLGPTGAFTTHPFNSWISRQAIYRFGFATAFPDGKDETTFGDIATATGLPEPHVRRLLRHAMTFHIFQEPRKGIVAHTAASKALADNPLLRQWIGMVSEEMWPAATKVVDALTRWPISQEPNQAGYNLAHSTDATIFEEISKHPEREERYGAAMTFGAAGPGFEFDYIVNGYDWGSIDNGTVVDVGGSHGSLSIAIAQHFPKLRCITQDLPEVVKVGQRDLPMDLQDRITFMAHDFFDEQPVKHADVYTLRQILHDWSDKYAMRILRALVPSLKADAKVLVLEQVLPEPNSFSKSQEKLLRSFDLSMWTIHNAKERDLDDWNALVKGSDSRFNVTKVTKPDGSRLSIIELQWRPRKA